jgi:hypothetical protein
VQQDQLQDTMRSTVSTPNMLWQALILKNAVQWGLTASRVRRPSRCAQTRTIVHPESTWQ